MCVSHHRRVHTHTLTHTHPPAHTHTHTHTGHLVLDEALNLTRILVDSQLVPKNKRRDVVEDFVPPSRQEAEAGVQVYIRVCNVYTRT
jgi:hypothetical protein